MHSKNKAAQTVFEREHVELVKLLSCGVCGAGGGYSAPSQAHELEQGRWFTSIPLCPDCHTGSLNGIHGEARIWSMLKKNELSVLDDTICRLFYAV